MSSVIKFGEEQLEMHQGTVTELERMGHETYNELQEVEEAGEEHYGYKDARQKLLDEMRDYRTAIRRNKASIEKCKLRIEALKRQ